MRMGKSRVAMAVVMAAAALPLLLTGCIRIVPGGDDILASPELVTREFDFADFTDMEVGYAFVVEVTRSDTYRVTITLNENLFDYLDVSRSGKTLRIRMKSPYAYHRTTSQASVALPDLRGLKLSGASRGEVSGFRSEDDMDFEVSGASNLELVDLKAGEARFDISGASRVTGNIDMTDGDVDVSGASTLELEGRASEVRLEVSGASTARLERFPMENADVRVSGASNATVEVSERLDIEVSGASRLTYDGGAELGSVDVSGGSTLNRR